MHFAYLQGRGSYSSLYSPAIVFDYHCGEIFFPSYLVGFSHVPACLCASPRRACLHPLCDLPLGSSRQQQSSPFASPSPTSLSLRAPDPDQPGTSAPLAPVCPCLPCTGEPKLGTVSRCGLTSAKLRGGIPSLTCWLHPCSLRCTGCHRFITLRSRTCRDFSAKLLSHQLVPACPVACSYSIVSEGLCICLC